MSNIKKILLSFAGCTVLALAGTILYAIDVGKGNLPATDPQNYTTIEANGLSFAVDIRGDKTGTPIILLHGFLETALMWDKIMDDLVAEGYYVIAPNQRGYSAGARPDDVEQYEFKYLTADVLAIADQLGVEQFHLIGHDWGAAVGWHIAAENSDRIISYGAISAPHSDALGKAYREDPLQFESSHYMRIFQTSIYPEFMMAKNDYAFLKTYWSQHNADLVEDYLNIFGQEQALTSILNWYRANFIAFTNGFELGQIHVPVILIWGNKDYVFNRSGAENTKDYVESDYQFIEMDTGHWIIQEQYQELKEHLFKHLTKYR